MGQQSVLLEIAEKTGGNKVYGVVKLYDIRHIALRFGSCVCCEAFDLDQKEKPERSIVLKIDRLG